MLCVCGTEGLESVTEGNDCLWAIAKDHSEHVLLKEAAAWEAEGVLLGEELLHEVFIISDVSEMIHV
jgi:hypothetical protein